MSSEDLRHVLIIPAGAAGRGHGVAGKAFVSSLMRSLFGGRIIVVHDDEIPWFKVERRQLEEIHLPGFSSENSMARWRDLIALIKPNQQEWVIVADPASLAMRNIDHLIPSVSGGSYPAQQVDFYWIPICQEEPTGDSECLASSGFWAVRAEYLSMVLERWMEVRRSVVNPPPGDVLWSRFVQELPLRKKRFEQGEVVAPAMHSIDWEGVSNAAVITLPHWPDAEQGKFIQALYYGTYLGDETGMILHVIEA